MAHVVPATKPDGNLMSSQVFAQVMHAFLECSDEIQSAIVEMVQIVNDPDATDDEKHAALSTIADALFPSHHSGDLGADLAELEESAPKKIKALLRKMDEQEAAFGRRVEALLHEKEMNQSDLAAAIGVSQPAVSMMLSRTCRPQKHTIEKIAHVFDIQPGDLWPAVELE